MKKKQSSCRALKIAALALAFALTQSDLVAQTVPIPDPDLEAVIRRALEKPNGDITVADMERLRVLSAGARYGEPHREITDISPLAKATNLKVLKVGGLFWGGPYYGGQVSDISALAGLTNLTELRLTDHRISDLSPLAGLTNLEELYLDRNQISDISPLAELTNLRTLHLYGNFISDITPLAGLTELENLRLGLFVYSRYSNLDWIRRNNEISDISPLAGLTNLTSLHLSANRISDIRPLASLTELEVLCLDANRISDISPLAGLEHLSLFTGECQGQTPDVCGTNGLHLEYNYIDTTPGSSARQIIDSLNAGEGVTVVFEPQYDPEPLMGGIPIAGQEDWYRSDWWGTYCTTFAPWLYHTEHGFIYRDPSSATEGMYIYDEGLNAWCWTSEDVYPAVYAFNPGADNQGVNIGAAWLWYYQDTRTPRSFSVLTGPSATQTLFFGP